MQTVAIMKAAPVSDQKAVWLQTRSAGLPVGKGA